jgi:predicted Zn-dependent peptidase
MTMRTPPSTPSVGRRRGAALALAAVVLLLLGGAEARQQTPDRSKPPAPGAPPALKVPPIERRTLPNGLRVWIVQMQEVPVVDVSVIVTSGAAADPPGRFGVAHFTAAMLDEGAGTRNALALADAVEYLGASLTTSSSFDASTVRLHTAAARLDQALPLLADVVLRPTFPQPDLERLRKERLATLLQSRDNPAAVSAAAFARVVFGPGHRFGTPVMGTETSNAAIAAEDLRTFYAAHYQPQNAAILVVGAVTPATVVPKLQQAFGGWRNTGAMARPLLATVAPPAARQIYLVDKPGAAQSQIRIGGVGVARSTPDYHVIDVMNTMLGGSFSSRLNLNLREEHGYSYGAGSVFDMRAAPGPFYAAAGVQTDKTVESLTEFFKELDGMRAPVPADELGRVRNLLALGFPGEFETTSAMAGKLSELFVYNLPDSFFNDYVPKVQAVGASDIERAATRYLSTDRFAVVVVGDLKTIEKPIRDANFGPVRVVPMDEILR